MSRVAKAPIEIPAGVTVDIAGQNVSVKGKNGTMDWSVHRSVQVALEDGMIKVAPAEGRDDAWAMAGTTRALLNNMVVGCGRGFERKLTLVGVGYRAQSKGDVLNLSLGFSHPIDYPVPAGISIETPSQTEILVKVPTSKKSDRSPRRSGDSGRRSRTRARACVTRMKMSCVRKRRRNRGFVEWTKNKLACVVPRGLVQRFASSALIDSVCIAPPVISTPR